MTDASPEESQAGPVPHDIPLAADVVLIVEDSQTQGRIISRMFARMGIESVVTPTLKDAYAHLGQRQWQLLLMDVFLERENTLEHIAELRDLAGSTPIAVMSAGQRNDPVVIRTMLNKARRERADFLLPKPFSFEDVKQIVIEIERKQRASAA
jgi:DNA-binding NtrC family response regulator